MYFVLLVLGAGLLGGGLSWLALRARSASLALSLVLGVIGSGMALAASAAAIDVTGWRELGIAFGYALIGAFVLTAVVTLVIARFRQAPSAS